MIFGNTFSGSLVSSTMLTESSNPTIAKNATAVATVTARNIPRSLAELNTTMRPMSASPWAIT